MASLIGSLVGQLPPLSICTNESKRAIIIESRYQLIQPPRHDVSWSCLIKGKISRYPIINGKFKLIVPFAQSSDSAFQILSLSDIIQQFYACINKKDMHGIGELISDDCRLEDYSFPGTLQGKKDTLSFFHHLTESMGENVRFRIGHVYEGYELVACADWHLEWKQDPIPFTRGCSLFGCSQEGERLLIKEIRIIIESPIKPGKIVLAMLKILTSVFDDFPRTAEWFLKSPRTILHILTSIYKLFLGPFMNPLLGFYVNLWKFIAQVLGYTIGILHCIAKLFK